MQIKDSRFHKVWKVEEKNGFKKIQLGDSKKEKDGNYSNWSWFDVTLVGNAKNQEINEGDTITILSGRCDKRKYNDKFYDDVVIFEFEVTRRSESNPHNQQSSPQQNSMQGFQAIDPGDDVPF